MATRNDILAAVRRHQPDEKPLPGLNHAWIQYPDRRAQFASVLQFVGGTCHSACSAAEINAKLADIPAYRSAKKIISLVPGVGQANVDLGVIDDPHQLEDVDFAILPGEFAVAENGAIWVTDRGIRQRVVYFLVQHLVLLVPADRIVHNMHEAYRRIPTPEIEFGVFISGPSKTADIEQSLVIGAHGPRSLNVFLVPGGQPGNGS